MKKTRPEDKPKLIVLAILTVAAVAFMMYRVMGAFAENREPHDHTPVTLSGDAAPEASVGQPEQIANQPVGAETNYADVSSGIPNGSSRDPFKSPLAKLDYDPFVPRSVSTNGDRLKPGQMGNGGAGAGGDGAVGPMQVPAPPPSTIELKGVLTGGRPIAVLRIGANTLNVFEGQAITKTLVVLKITTSSILMRNRNTDIYLEVGNSTLADIYLPEARAAGSISTEVPTAEEPSPSPAQPATVETTGPQSAPEAQSMTNPEAEPVSDPVYGPF
ncbi:MAG: hypothetical protein H0W86_13350 [Armatimonadetes bacterium]|nr:hypothetical protein [Armatimonadota bacterium]